MCHIFVMKASAKPSTVVPFSSPFLLRRSTSRIDGQRKACIQTRSDPLRSRDQFWKLQAAIDFDSEASDFGEYEGRRDGEKSKSGFEEQIVELTRVTKVEKGGRLVRFRATMVVGDGRGRVGVGNGSAKEIPQACERAARDAKKNMIKFPLNKASSFPHRQEAKLGAAKVMLRPAREGTGVIAGGAVRTVLETAGVRNGYGKILNSNSHMNTAKATVKALSMMRTLKEVAKLRGVSIPFLLGKTMDPTREGGEQPEPDMTTQFFQLREQEQLEEVFEKKRYDEDEEDGYEEEEKVYEEYEEEDE